MKLPQTVADVLALPIRPIGSTVDDAFEWPSRGVARGAEDADRQIWVVQRLTDGTFCREVVQ